MNLPYRTRPGGGFVVLLLSVLGCLCFIGWGALTPPLDRVWRMQIELSLGEGSNLTDRDFRLLQDTLHRYPELADNMLDERAAGLVSANASGVVDVGFAYLVRKGPDTPAQLKVAATSDKRVEVEARTLEGVAAGEAAGATAFTWQLPNDGPFPQLIEVLAGSKRGRKRAEKHPEEDGAGKKIRPVVVTLSP